MIETISTTHGDVDYYGPSAVEIRKALDKAGHTKSTPGRTINSIPSVGYVVKKPREVAYVEVSATMNGYIARYRSTLERAGYIVTESPNHRSTLAVFCTPRNRDANGKVIRARG